MVKPTRSFAEDGQVTVANSLVRVSGDSMVQVLLTNLTGFTQKPDMGLCIGDATEVEMLESESSEHRCSDDSLELGVRVGQVSSLPESERRVKLAKMFAEVGPTLCWQERAKLHALLLDKHEAFSVEEFARRHSPKKQAVRPVPFAVRHEIAH